MPTIDRTALEALSVAGCVLGMVSLLLAIVLLARLARMRRELAVLESADGAPETLLGALEKHAVDVAAARREVAAARSEAALARAELAEAIRHVAVVRYDAFSDMGGRMSFSAALLDDSGDGLVFTSINGRSETRSYAKGVRGGHGDHELSPEEAQAVALARNGSAPELVGRYQRGA